MIDYLYNLNLFGKLHLMSTSLLQFNNMLSKSGRVIVTSSVQPLAISSHFKRSSLKLAATFHSRNRCQNGFFTARRIDRAKVIAQVDTKEIDGAPVAPVDKRDVDGEIVAPYPTAEIDD
jgi:hypothetical protein